MQPVSPHDHDAWSARQAILRLYDAGLLDEDSATLAMLAVGRCRAPAVIRNVQRRRRALFVGARRACNPSTITSRPNAKLSSGSVAYPAEG